MNNTNDKEDDNPTDVKQSEKMKTTSKIYVKQPHEILKDSALKNTNDDVQRAIEGLKEIPDEELQEFLDDEDFMEGLDVVDAWEGDEERNRENDQDKTNAVERKERRSSR